MSAIRLAHVASRLQQNERGLEWTTLAESANHRARDADAVMVENARGNIARNEGDFVSTALPATAGDGGSEGQARPRARDDRSA